MSETKYNGEYAKPFNAEILPEYEEISLNDQIQAANEIDDLITKTREDLGD